MRYFPGLALLLMAMGSDLPAQVVEGQHEFTIIVEEQSLCDGVPVVYDTPGYNSHLITAEEASDCLFRIEVRGGAGVAPTGSGKNSIGGRGAVITFDYAASSQTELRLMVGRAGLSYSRGGEASAVKAGTTLLAVAGGGGAGANARLVDTRKGTAYAYLTTSPSPNGAAPTRSTQNVANDTSSFGILNGNPGQTQSYYVSWSTGCVRYYLYGGAGGSGFTAGSGGNVSVSGYCSGPRNIYAYSGRGGGSFLSTVASVTSVSNGIGNLSEAGMIVITKIPK